MLLLPRQLVIRLKLLFCGIPFVLIQKALNHQEECKLLAADFTEILWLNPPPAAASGIHSSKEYWCYQIRLIQYIFTLNSPLKRVPRDDTYCWKMPSWGARYLNLPVITRSGCFFPRRGNLLIRGWGHGHPFLWQLYSQRLPRFGHCIPSARNDSF